MAEKRTPTVEAIQFKEQLEVYLLEKIRLSTRAPLLEQQKPEGLEGWLRKYRCQHENLKDRLVTLFVLDVRCEDCGLHVQVGTSGVYDPPEL